MTTADNPDATQAFDLDRPSDTAVATVRRDALDAARHYQQRSRSASTWRTYASAWRHFIAWCEQADFQALPASGECVAQFLATEARRGLAPTTLAHRLAAIRLAHVGAGHPSPHETLAVTEVMRGIRSDWGRPPVKKTAAVDDDLRLMADTIDTTTLAGLRDRALLLYGFAGAFRRSELVGLDVSDLETHPRGQLVTIRRSKTDQAAQGQTVAVLAQPGSPWCPVAALAAWQDAAGITIGALFRRLYRGGRVGEQRLAAAHVATVVKATCRPLGLDPERYAGHSLRRGFLTSAGQAGADLVALVAQSRHTRVDSVLQYLEPRERFERHAGQALLKQSDPIR